LEVNVRGRKASFPALSAADAHAALRWLHATGKVTAREISGALKERENLVREIKNRLEALGGEGLMFLTNPAALRPRTPRRRKASRKAQAAWRAQGRYMAAVRRLSKADRAKVKAARERGGVSSALRLARKLGGRK
jgi:hypothetical protein